MTDLTNTSIPDLSNERAAEIASEADDTYIGTEDQGYYAKKWQVVHIYARYPVAHAKARAAQVMQKQAAKKAAEKKRYGRKKKVDKARPALESTMPEPDLF